MVEASNSTQALRYNAGKIRLSLISPLAMEGVADVLGFGAQKYAAWNWTKGLPIDQCLDSLMRHIAQIQKGELIDKESGKPHIDHVQCNAMFLSHYYHNGDWERLAVNMPPTITTKE